MNKKVLIVDDEVNLLDACRRNLRDLIDLDTALSGEEALATLDRGGPYATIVSDMQMPGMNGIELLKAVRERAPSTVRIMLTGDADQKTAIEAVNQGQIFRFLNKPCSPKTLARAILSGIAQHNLVNAERELLEKTLRGSVQVLVDVLALANPEAFGRATRVSERMKELIEAMRLEDGWQLETAALLSQIGCVILEAELLRKVMNGDALDEEETRLYRQHAATGADLLAKVPRMGEVAEAIRYQGKNYDGTGVPGDERAGDAIPLGGRLLRVVLDLDHYEQLGASRREAVDRLKASSRCYDPAILAELTVVDATSELPVHEVTVAELEDGMILAEAVRARTGLLLAVEGREVTRVMRQRLSGFRRGRAVKEPLHVYIPARTPSS